MSDTPNNEPSMLPVRRTPSDAVIQIGPTQTLDLSTLSEPERNALLEQYRKGVLDVSRKAQEMQVDVGALSATLATLAGTTRSISEAGNSVTITHSQSTTIGRTEVIMGNTENAQRGKLSRSQTGERDWTPLWIIGGVVVALTLLALFFRPG